MVLSMTTLRAACLCVLAATAGCSKSDPAPSWNTLASCLAGKAAQADLPTRLKLLRQSELAAAGETGKDRWPARCAPSANQLYDALVAGDDQPILRRKLEEKLGCAPEKQSCAFPADSSVVPIATDLWEATKGAGLVASAPAGNVPEPPTAPEPAVNGASWKPFSAQPKQLVGPLLTSDGRAVVLLKAAEGRTRPTACEFAAGFDKMTCIESNAQVPELPPQSVELVRDSSGLFAAGLSEKGMVGYDLKTGAKTDVRGGSGAMVRDGAAVEPGDGDIGFVAVSLKGGKAGKPVPLPSKTPLTKPIALADQAIWVEGDGGPALIAKTVAGGGLRDSASVKGKFGGPFHTCQKGKDLGVATWDRHAKQGGKGTAGAESTQLAASLYRDGKWSNALEATLPLNRAVESELVCTASGASMAWARNVEGTVQVGRIDCTSDGCKSSDAKLPGTDSKWWWAVGPLGDKVFLVWKGALGETRLRVGTLAELPQAKDVILFDSADFGGPTPGDAVPVVSDSAALLIFKSDKPVALHIGAAGGGRLLAAN